MKFSICRQHDLSTWKLPLPPHEKPPRTSDEFGSVAAYSINTQQSTTLLYTMNKWMPKLKTQNHL